MTPVGLAHAVCATLVPAGAIVATFRERSRAVALSTAALGAVALVAGLVRLRPWEPTYRRAIFIVSHTAGEWLDRKQHFGFAAVGFAIAASFAMFDRDAPAWLLRVLWLLSASFGLAALVISVVLRARVVPAAIY